MNIKIKLPVFSNVNKSAQRSKIIEKYGDNLESIFNRIPMETLKEMPVIEQMKNLKRKRIINIINGKRKPDIIRIDEKMDE